MVQSTFEMAHLAALYSTPSRRHHLHTSYQMKMDGENQCHRDERFIKVTPSSKLLKPLYLISVCRNINLSTRSLYSRGGSSVDSSSGDHSDRVATPAVFLLFFLELQRMIICDCQLILQSLFLSPFWWAQKMFTSQSKSTRTSSKSSALGCFCLINWITKWLNTFDILTFPSNCEHIICHVVPSILVFTGLHPKRTISAFTCTAVSSCDPRSMCGRATRAHRRIHARRPRSLRELYRSVNLGGRTPILAGVKCSHGDWGYCLNADIIMFLNCV